MRQVCADLDTELVEFNGESDQVHLLVATHLRWRFRFWLNDSKAATHTRCDASLPALCSRPHARPPLVLVLLPRLLRRRTLVEHQAVHRRASPTTVNAGLRPAARAMGSPRTEV